MSDVFERDKMERALNMTLKEIITASSIAYKLGGGDLETCMAPQLSVKFMEVAKEAGATPPETIMAMVNYLTTVILVSQED